MQGVINIFGSIVYLFNSELVYCQFILFRLFQVIVKFKISKSAVILGCFVYSHIKYLCFCIVFCACAHVINESCQV